jgi:hypothetical protein
MFFLLAACAVGALLAGAVYFAFGSTSNHPDGTAPVAPIVRHSPSVTPHQSHGSGAGAGVLTTAVARHASTAKSTSAGKVGATPKQAAVVTSSATSSAAASPSASGSSSPTPTASTDGAGTPTDTPTSPAPVTS